MNIRKTYHVPSCLVVEIVNESVLCESHQPGTNESVGYEDWPLLGNNLHY